ncbi:MAG: DUF1566 domain-containing protein [Nitrospinota bacterium]|nr:DUF1566 domain-containing protein [Nitrospinota bacterium]
MRGKLRIGYCVMLLVFVAGDWPASAQLPFMSSSLKKGEVYRALNGRESLRVVSKDEIEDEHGTVAKYTVEGDRVRLVVGGVKAYYYKIIKEGLVEERSWTVLYSPSNYDAAVRRAEEARVKKEQQARTEREKREREAEEAQKKAAQAKAKRFTVSSDGVITDTQTGLQWVVGPDNDMSYEEAENWVLTCNISGGSWRLPTNMELRTLYIRGEGKRNMAQVFNSTGREFWAENSSSGDKAWYFDFEDGKEYHRYKEHSDSYPHRVFGVRSSPR